MTNEHVDTQVIKVFTGHTSNAVEGYKHISDGQRRVASTIIQGHAKKTPTATVSKPPDDSCNENVMAKATDSVKVVD